MARRAGAARQHVPGGAARHGGRRLPGRRRDRLGAGRGARRLHRGALGLAACCPTPSAWVTALSIMPLFCLASAAVLMAGTRVFPAELNAARTLAAMTMASD